MSDDVLPILLDYLTKRYDHIKHSLVRVLGNDDLAGEALQDTWLRLQSREGLSPIKSPRAYLVRMAVNIAVDIQRRQGRTLSYDDVSSVMDLSDHAPGPAKQFEDEVELTSLLEALDGLPRRCREILIMVRWEDLPRKEVAERFGISLRMVEYELKRAHDYCDNHMLKKTKKVRD
ncbi:RNA polymerase sigma factor [Sodalis ligni]|uniref:RNA polymerase sigma-70 factor (ECF subfamily) n=1 Tax=Sodalis ligni TaxID=2697027 RepID=A0A4R1NQS4_9GAMM|nr:sigma-70 family RNA polymerase sigma factor [Sodalis ligni]TCL06750.1 RNA polymerase sigma-70 factor (ECF subfamily) [Sodalis ligni]